VGNIAFVAVTSDSNKIDRSLLPEGTGWKERAAVLGEKKKKDAGSGGSPTRLKKAAERAGRSKRLGSQKSARLRYLPNWM